MNQIEEPERERVRLAGRGGIACMSKPVLRIEGSASLVEAIATMKREGIRHLAVSADRTIIGVLSISDVLRAYEEPGSRLPAIRSAAAVVGGDGVPWRRAEAQSRAPLWERCNRFMSRRPAGVSGLLSRQPF